MNETVVVVGATGEMGRQISRDLSTQGYRVVAVARSAEALSALGQDVPTLVPCATDIISDDAIDAIRGCLEGTVRAVVHGPGVPTAGGIASAPTSAILEATNIKVGGFVRLVRACDAHFVRGSRLIAIGGHYGFEPTAYAATAGVGNAALANVVRQYSWTMGDRGITAHLLAPGPADTPRLRRVAATRAEQEGVEPDVVLDRMRTESALGEFTEVESVSWAIGVLLDPRANALAGSTLFMDAGRRRGLP